MRHSIIINDNWKFLKSDVLTFFAAPGGEKVNLPHTWNALDGQDGGNDYWRGTAQYVRTFDPEDLNVYENARVYLEFAGVAMSAHVYVNGQPVIDHSGGFSTFRGDITDLVKDGENLINVLVDNSENDRVYPQRADFTFYGGIYRDVKLVVIDETHFNMDFYGGKGIKITPEVDGTSAKITCEAWVSGGDNVSFHISSAESEDVSASAPVEDGYARAVITMENCHLWDGLDDPFLYEVTADLEKNTEIVDSVDTRIGLRSFYADPEKGFFLNGRSYPLRGVSRHQDRMGVGNALTEEMMVQDVDLILEIGANTIRLAHYQHCQEFYDLCDEKGLVIWAEIPYITNHMDNGYDNTMSQMMELIEQCYHHPSIVCWGLSNEITVGGQRRADHRFPCEKS